MSTPKRLPRKSTQLSPLTPIFQGLIRQLGLEKEMDMYRLSRNWEKIVGKQVASHTAPEKIRFHTLSLLVDNAPWMHQLSFFKKEIVEKTNRFFGSNDPKKPPIRDIYFKMGPLPASPVETETPPLKRKDRNRTRKKEEADALFHEAIKTVSSEEIRETIRQAIARHL